MYNPGLSIRWGIVPPSTGGEAHLPPKFDVWVVNQIFLNRVGANSLASQLKDIPLSETRLRDEGIIPYYLFVRNLVNILESSAREHGVTAVATPETPEDWSKEASTDYEALAAQFRPHMAEPSRGIMDWLFGLRSRDPKPHWTSVVAVNSVVLDLLIQMMPASDEVLADSKWGPFMAQMTGWDIKRIEAAISEEILRIGAQEGSGWNEEEAKGLVNEYLVQMAGMMTVGT